MKLASKRLKKNKFGGYVSRARVVEASDIDYEMLMAAAIAGVAFHASDGGPCDCWGEDTQWVALPFTKDQLLHQSATQLLLTGVAHPPGCKPSTSG